MPNTHTIDRLLTTNCLIVDARADLPVMLEAFSLRPVDYLPVLEGCRFVGLLFRSRVEALQASGGGLRMDAATLASPDVPVLHPGDPLSEARELFRATELDALPVVDQEGDLVGLLHREALEEATQALWKKARTT